ncbi:GNAT family N-acetyltransferase [Rothia sp. LK2588]|uniref:GNAT family N-acetyltransferase n=1 Tax=Rothia sp. LK2588 TaxID=3114369 RepID=UPI0034CDDCFE
MFSLFPSPGDHVVVRPLTTDEWGQLEAMIETDPAVFLYALEHLEHFGLPAPSTLNLRRNPFGFMGIFAPEAATPCANSGFTADAGGGGIPEVTAQVRRKVARGLREVAVQLAPRAAQLTAPNRPSPVADPGTEVLDVVPAQRAHTESPLQLVGAFWLGSNCVPLTIPACARGAVAAVIARHRRSVASIFGSAEQVLPLWELLAPRMGRPLSVRPNQPLLTLDLSQDLADLADETLERPGLSAPPLSSGGARWARTSDRRSLLKASVAMFVEEVGYDPMTRDAAGYARRVEEYIRTGRSVVATNRDGVVVFKADLGLAHESYCQIQGVWLHPAYRGRGLSKTLLAQSFDLIRTRFPQISLYVNDYNHTARALYEALGMRQHDTFSTILF